MGGSFSRSESRSKPVIEPAAISPGQREQLYPILGEMLGFSYGPTIGADGGGGGGGQTFPGYNRQGNPTPWNVKDMVPKFSNMGTQWGKGSFAYKDATKSFDQLNLAPAQSVYRGQLESAMSNPYAPTSAEQNLLNSIMGTTSAQFANRGFGASPIAASTVGASIAPSLIAMRQQQLTNLMAALGIDISEGQKLDEQKLTQREQDIGAFTKQREKQIAGLLDFLKSMGLSRNMGDQSASSGFGISGSMTSTGGTSSAPGGGQK